MDCQLSWRRNSSFFIADQAVLCKFLNVPAAPAYGVLDLQALTGNLRLHNALSAHD
jgi:hypothetical protein